jgi:hypothetical protein
MANHYRNDLTNHLPPFFKDHRLSRITVVEVDRYRQNKVREAAEITAAAENGAPLMVSHVDRLGRSYRRRAAAFGPLDQHAHRSAGADPRGRGRSRPYREQPSRRQAPSAEGL